MRLWHKDLIPVLPRKQLMGQWLECNILINNIEAGKEIKELFIIKVKDYPLQDLLNYTKLVYNEMLRRGYNPNKATLEKCMGLCSSYKNKTIFKDWHDKRYLRQCYYNLQEKYDCGGIKKEEWDLISPLF